MRSGPLEWAYAMATLPGQAQCGDQPAVIEAGDRVLVAAVDGLGHGQEAARASQAAIAVLKNWAREEGLIAIMQRCHVRLAGTRGAVMSLALFDAGAGTVTWLGVGNVAGRLIRKVPGGNRKDTELLLRAGVIGDQLPLLQSATLPIGRGDRVILVTDGIDPAFAERVDTTMAVDELPHAIIAWHGKANDDALALVLEYQG